MTLVAGPEEIINIVGALLVVALGAFVASVRPRRPGNRAFATFCISFGISIGATNILLPGEPALQLVVWSVVLVFALVETGALVALAVRVPAPLPRSERWMLLPAGGLALVYFVLWSAVLWSVRDGVASGFLVDPSVEPLVLAAFVGAAAGTATWIGYLLLLALRAGRIQRLSESAYGTLCAGLVIFPAAFHGFWAAMDDGSLSLFGFPFLPFIAVVAATWLVQSARGRWSRTCRNLALFTFAVPLGALLYGSAGWPGGFGVARTLSVLIFGYALLSGQLLGIDVKVRWGISKTSVAAAFIAVFFVASEGAQILFSERSQWVGLAAAGALVFAIAPLQRAADRLAEKAVPLTAAGARHASPALAAGRDDAYRAALRFALRDRKLSREEELELANLADHLGLPARRALELRHEVEGSPRPPKRARR